MPGVPSILGEKAPPNVTCGDECEVVIGVGGATWVDEEGRIEVDRMVKGPMENDEPFVRT